MKISAYPGHTYYGECLKIKHVLNFSILLDRMEHPHFEKKSPLKIGDFAGNSITPGTLFYYGYFQIKLTAASFHEKKVTRGRGWINASPFYCRKKMKHLPLTTLC